MSLRPLFALLFLPVLVACGGEHEPAPVRPEQSTATPSTEHPRAALLKHLEAELEQVERRSPPPLTLGGPGKIGIGGGPWDPSLQEAPADDK